MTISLATYIQWILSGEEHLMTKNKTQKKTDKSLLFSVTQVELIIFSSFLEGILC